MQNEKEELVDNSGARALGMLMFVGGVAAAFYSFAMDTSVMSPIGRVSNLSLMRNQEMVFFGGLAVGLVGILIAVLSPSRVRK